MECSKCKSPTGPGPDRYNLCTKCASDQTELTVACWWTAFISTHGGLVEIVNRTDKTIKVKIE